mgnify:CR=1 FL=1
MFSSFIRNFSVLFIGVCSATAGAGGPTWALPHAQEITRSTLELNAGYAQFPQGGLALARVDVEAPITKHLSGSFIAHEWMALGLLNQRFFVTGFRYRMDVSKQLALAPFVQSVFFDGGGALDRRLTVRSGLAVQRRSVNWALDLSIPIIGAKNFPTHPADTSWSPLGILDLLLATETGITWTGWTNHELRLGIMGTLVRLSYRTTIKDQPFNAQFASMGSHSFLLIGWETSWGSSH